MNSEANKFNEQEAIKKLISLLDQEGKVENLSQRNARLAKILKLLAGGAALATVIAMPGTAKLLKGFFKEEQSDWDEWKQFNKRYLRQAIRRFEKQKIIEIVDNGNYGEVRLTENGRKRIIKMGLENLTISRPDRWDEKWRMVFYDVFEGDKRTREKFRKYLKAAGFYPLQKSVYLHAYPCEKEIEFLKYFLGLSGAVRIVIADKIENDREFRDYFGVS